ncbi:TIM barrel protein [Aliamphritea spongicola]|nr:TIM barrel protein [Aliamphritea spongicola]
MPDFAVNLNMLFTELPLKQRFRAAAEAGFQKVEIQFPYELSIAEIKEELEQHKLELILINAPAGDWAAGERGIACHPDRIDEQQQGVAKAIRYATALNCKKLIYWRALLPKIVKKPK